LKNEGLMLRVRAIFALLFFLGPLAQSLGDDVTEL
jgi:hypothetical protein